MSEDAACAPPRRPSFREDAAWDDWLPTLLDAAITSPTGACTRAFAASRPRGRRIAKAGGRHRAKQVLQQQDWSKPAEHLASHDRSGSAG